VKNSPSEGRERLQIHLIAIGGTGMAPLACLLQGQGHRVRGSDKPLYPPMSTLLADAGIEPMVGFDPARLDPERADPPDLVIVGNAVPRDNPEALAAERLAETTAVERISMPEALWRFFLDGRHRVVAAGTHGKTTTTAMASWVWTACGADPSYLIGGLPKNLPQSFHEGAAGTDFIVEGDEYNAAYFDRGPKFLHYRADTLILTSVEYDHADLYPSHQDLLGAYRSLVASVPPEGLVIGCGDTPELRELVRDAACRVVLYGFDPEVNDVHPEGGLTLGPDGTSFTLVDTLGIDRFDEDGPDRLGGGERVSVELGVPGRHNAANGLAVYIAARHRGFPAADVARALGEFRGVARRLDELGTAGGVTVIDDFAHHPTAVTESLSALSHRYPGRRLVALFEPRSLTAGRAFLHRDYLRAVRGADRVLFAPFFYAERFEDGERIDFVELARELGGEGVEARQCESVDELFERAVAEAREGDVIVTMSSGSFEGMPRRVLDALPG
jgi:UDP-N-acetylmuramate: L-alanyl-gamma-D-glutamyl-meso-diaminopimelate ligase